MERRRQAGGARGRAAGEVSRAEDSCRGLRQRHVLSSQRSRRAPWRIWRRSNPGTPGHARHKELSESTYRLGWDCLPRGQELGTRSSAGISGYHGSAQRCSAEVQPGVKISPFVLLLNPCPSSGLHFPGGMGSRCPLPIKLSA